MKRLADMFVNTDGLATPRARSSSRVRFDLGANEAHSPEAPKKSTRQDDETDGGDRHRRHRHSDKRSSRHQHRERSRSRDRDRDRDSTSLMNDKYERPPSSAAGPSGSGKSRRRDRDDDEEESEGTVDLPERFDEHGNPKAESGDALQQLLGNLASRFLGGDGEEEEGRSGRRRSRH